MSRKRCYVLARLLGRLEYSRVSNNRAASNKRAGWKIVDWHFSCRHQIIVQGWFFKKYLSLINVHNEQNWICIKNKWKFTINKIELGSLSLKLIFEIGILLKIAKRAGSNKAVQAGNLVLESARAPARLLDTLEYLLCTYCFLRPLLHLLLT